jgi:Acyl-CoA synthetases (AMP-forming)/AMP-acid ligases II
LGKLVNKQISNEVVFLGINDQKLGQKLVLLIEGNESDEIKNQLSAIIYPSKNHKPKKVVFKKEFPRLPNGKIDRLKLLNSLIK